MNLPIGVSINALSVILGGIFGTLVKDKMTTELKVWLTCIFGVCAIGMGVNSITSMQNMPAVIFSVVIGTGIGLTFKLSDKIRFGASKMQAFMAKFIKNKSTELSEEENLAELVTLIVLFCFSGTGVFGALTEGISGDSTILISKSILDFFTAAIFACHLGSVVSMVAVPQFIIGIVLFFLANVIIPLTIPSMISDFTACGGFIMIATGFRLMKVKEFPIADMIPAMILVMPLSFIWINFILPLL